MNKFILIVSCMLVLTACQSKYKLPMTKGEWMPVNEIGFIPPNATKYRDDVSTLTQNVDNQEQGEAE